jgi:glycosyltransferase involved in cell wall biosynthesis
MEIVASEFDAAYYLANYLDVVEAGVDPLEHFFYTGWREGRNPNQQFDTDYYLGVYADARDGDINPFWHFLSIGRAEGHQPRRPEVALVATDAEQPVAAECDNGSQLALVQSEFDVAYYLASYPDVAGAGVDPLRHFFFTGWREGRNPNQSFDSGYYLTANEDVCDAGLNPFWHYLVSGRSEGRLPRRPGGYKRANIDAAVAPSQRPPVDPDPNETEITAEQLRARLDRLRKARSGGLIVSFSHDCYIKVIGGTQIFISDEQKRFNEQDCGYLHLSPQLARLSLSEKSSRFLVRVVADGDYVGLVELKAVSACLKEHKRKRSERAIYIVHCALGFHVPDMIQLWKDCRPKRSIYWLHDYSSLCPGFNLLRNDAEFCGAPPKESLACRVCIYGRERASHVSQLKAMFAACNFDVLSPSQFALNLWLRSTELPHRSAAVHSHWQLVPVKGAPTRPSRDGPLSIAFLGYPSPNKGWQIFQEVVSQLSDEPGIRFSHFAARNVATLPKVEFVPTEVTAEDRRAALNALAERGVKVLLLLSPWPETFSFVLHEAIAAGAYIFCLTESGNVADVVQREQVGKVFRGVDDLVDFIRSGAALSFVREADAVRPVYEIASTGTTASSSVIHAGRA